MSKTKPPILLIEQSDDLCALLHTSFKLNGRLHSKRSFKEAFDALGNIYYALVICKIDPVNVDRFVQFSERINHCNFTITVVCVVDTFSKQLMKCCFKNGADEVILKEGISDFFKGYFIEESKFIPSSHKRLSFSSNDFIGHNQKIRDIKKDVVKLLKYNPDVILIEGESGVGKNSFTNFIYSESTRKEGPFIHLSCSAIPDSLIESELFGHEKGAYTGAIQTKAGKFELAHNGVILLDEISEIPYHLQAKLLHVIENKRFYSVGGHQEIKSDFMVIATTNQDLVEMVKCKQFRKDLFFRISKIFYKILPLRERKEDIPHLMDYFIQKWQSKYNHTVTFSRSALKKMIKYSYPGNVRELFNSMESAVMRANGHVDDNDIQFYFDACTSPEESTLNKKTIEAILNQFNGNISEAAKQIGYTREGLSKKIKKMQITI